MNLKIVCKDESLRPFYATAGAAGFDICAAEDDYILPGKTIMVSTQLYVAVPEGFELQVRSRSGAVYKRGIAVANSPGTIDSDYRGEIKVLLHNLCSDFGTIIRKGERIAQGVIAPVVKASFDFVEELDTTDRGAGGFGSTGV